MPTQTEIGGCDAIVSLMDSLTSASHGAICNTPINIDRLAAFARLYDTILRSYNDTTNP